ncbi:hypothetical protein IM40_04010 [Candidatus Paracaedimonas acanthamoebae]|nr:hypothetical protein IM40_04010 [Candidatus Paracaedimonas acanthamoebae]
MIPKIISFIKKYIEQEYSIKNASNPTTTRISKNEADSIGIRLSTEREEFKKPLSSYEVPQQNQGVKYDPKLEWRRQFEARNPELAAQLGGEMHAEAKAHRLKILSDKQVRVEPTPSEKLNSLLRDHKFACNAYDKT